MSWSTANHETIPEQEFLLPEGTMHPYLWAFLQSDGEVFKESVDDYQAVRNSLTTSITRFHGRPIKGRSPTDDVSASRLRTWKALFERAGLVTTDVGGVLQVSPFGRAVRDLFEDLTARVAGANEHLSQWAITVLNRYPLRNPLEANDATYPEDSDLFPFRAIWQVARALGNHLHWQEMNRGLMLIYYQHQIEGVIEKIENARSRGGEKYFEDPVRWLGAEAAVEDAGQTRRRITPWLSRASFGGLLAEDNEETGLWTLRSDRIDLIDDALREEVSAPEGVLEDRYGFTRWLTAPLIRTTELHGGVDERNATSAVIDAARTFGRSRIIALSGIPGTGKSRLARIVADELTDGDRYRQMEVQFHEGAGYEDFVEGFTPRADGSGFKLVDKTLRVISRRAIADPQSRPYVLVIEEFTRANVHAVLGELLTYVEHRGRKFRYAISQEESIVPENLIIIATMNPRDRSASQLDLAVRRRLYYFDVPPSSDALNSMLKDKLSPGLLDNLTSWYKKWSGTLPFGHGIFAQVDSDESLNLIWSGTCLRLLEDAFGEVEDSYREAVGEFPCKQNSESD